jgi:hypothetical protein
MKHEVWNELPATFYYGLKINFFTALGGGVRNYNENGGGEGGREREL